MIKYGICLLMCLIFGVLTKKSSRSYNVCESLSCMESARAILNNLNTSADPCVNFYEFACGSFTSNTIIPDNEQYVTTESMLDDLVLEQLYSLLENPEKTTFKGFDVPVFKKVRQFYNLCMNTDDIESRGEKPVRDILRQIGNWPLFMPKWDASSYSWQTHIVKLIKTGILSNFIIDLTIMVDPKNLNRKIIKIDEPSVDMGGEKWHQQMDNNKMRRYYNYMVQTVTLFLPNHLRNTKLIIKDMGDVFNFERKMASISTWQDSKNKFCYHISIEHLNSKYNYLDWLKFLNEIFESYITLDLDETVYMCEPTYFERLETLVKETPKRVIANFLSWRVIDTFVTFLPQKYRKIYFDLQSNLADLQIKPYKWKECVIVTSKLFDIAVSSMYVRKYFDKQIKTEANNLLRNIRAVFINFINALPWMSIYTKKRAYDKVKNIHNYIAFSEDLFNDQKLGDYYQNLKIFPDLGYLKNTLNLNNYHFHMIIKNYRKLYAHDWFAFAPAYHTNSFYSNIENSFKIPVGLLQGMFFAKDRPKYLNYGGLGFIIGHEITHGFDERGRYFDKDGLKINWWDEATTNKFAQKANCITEQYTVAQMKRNYRLNLKEQMSMSELNAIKAQKRNIADIGGLRSAYIAYKKWSSKKEEPLLPGINVKYTQNQLFWISAANRLCSVFKKSFVEKLLKNHLHIPAELRVNIPMQNIKGFAEDWNCDKDSPMNPKERCVVW